ncbi:MAG: hypothetical protein Q4E45_08295 [Eubacteriales bacterium]|nr:hypothetical protein [Eubacteriales bacterium]
MKKLISVVLCLLMIAGIVTIGKPAAAEDAQGKVVQHLCLERRVQGLL